MHPAATFPHTIGLDRFRPTQTSSWITSPCLVIYDTQQVGLLPAETDPTSVLCLTPESASSTVYLDLFHFLLS